MIERSGLDRRRHDARAGERERVDDDVEREHAREHRDERDQEADHEATVAAAMTSSVVVSSAGFGVAGEGREGRGRAVVALARGAGDCEWLAHCGAAVRRRTCQATLT